MCCDLQKTTAAVLAVLIISLLHLLLSIFEAESEVLLCFFLVALGFVYTAGCCYLGKWDRLML